MAAVQYYKSILHWSTAVGVIAAMFGIIFVILMALMVMISMAIYEMTKGEHAESVF